MTPDGSDPMHAVKEYSPEPGRKIEVYRNLHNGLLSVRDAKTKRVIGHAESVTLTDAVFKVSEAGRQRAVREGRRNVHAFAIGYETDQPMSVIGDRITYNPFRAPHFHYAGTETVAQIRASAIVTPQGVWEAC